VATIKALAVLLAEPGRVAAVEAFVAAVDQRFGTGMDGPKNLEIQVKAAFP